VTFRTAHPFAGTGTRLGRRHFQPVLTRLNFSAFRGLIAPNAAPSRMARNRAPISRPSGSRDAYSRPLPIRELCGPSGPMVAQTPSWHSALRGEVSGRIAPDSCLECGFVVLRRSASFPPAPCTGPKVWGSNTVWRAETVPAGAGFASGQTSWRGVLLPPAERERAGQRAGVGRGIRLRERLRRNPIRGKSALPRLENCVIRVEGTNMCR
jgi:hypothetical protein